jgi:hypothetical protein
VFSFFENLKFEYKTEYRKINKEENNTGNYLGKFREAFPSRELAFPKVFLGHETLNVFSLKTQPMRNHALFSH